MSMRVTIRCPHCEGRAIARSSREMSRTMREIIYACDDPECGHTYVANLEVVRTISPSAKPNLAVALPISKHTKSLLVQQFDLFAA